MQGWGNKEVPLRACSVVGRTGVLRDFELKLLDATANPYLAMAAVVASGARGLRLGLRLPLSLQVDPSKLGEAAVKVSEHVRQGERRDEEAAVKVSQAEEA